MVYFNIFHKYKITNSIISLIFTQILQTNHNFSQKLMAYDAEAKTFNKKKKKHNFINLL